MPIWIPDIVSRLHARQSSDTSEPKGTFSIQHLFSFARRTLLSRIFFGVPPKTSFQSACTFSGGQLLKLACRVLSGIHFLPSHHLRLISHLMHTPRHTLPPHSSFDSLPRSSHHLILRLRIARLILQPRYSLSYSFEDPSLNDRSLAACLLSYILVVSTGEVV